MKLAPRRRADAVPDAFAAGMRPGFLGRRRGGLAAAAVVAAAAIGGATLWSWFGERVRSDPDQVLLPDQIELEGKPAWVRGDLKMEALRDASLDRGLPLDDPELARRLARAFDMHPWVRRVVGVRLRHPAAAVVEVVCREPAAMVGVPGGLLAVDAEGIVLPSQDFTPESAADYPRVSGIASSPVGAAGFPWGDPLVQEAAALAAAIGPDWKLLGFRECRPAPIVAAGDGRSWELVADGRVIRFGSAPGHERPGEPSAAAKIARLRSLPADAADVDLTLDPQSSVRSIPAG